METALPVQKIRSRIEREALYWWRVTGQASMISGIVFDIKKFSLHDGPGIRTTVFLKGCGLRCRWCHNPESQHPGPELMLRPELCVQCGACLGTCPQGAIAWDGECYVTDRTLCTGCGECTAACYAEARELVGREMTVDQVLADIMRDAAFYDESGGGVTFSGGEPLLQGDFLLALLRACKAQGLHTALDTCGYAPTGTLNAVREHVDLFLYDLKLMDDARHRQVTGVSNALILDHLRLLAENGHRIILRVPIVPHVNDDDDNIRQIAALAHDLPSIERIDILAYHRIGNNKYERLDRPNPMPETAPPSADRLSGIVRAFESAGLRVKLGG
jgi:pyruvate formate lyase activating enzyme